MRRKQFNQNFLQVNLILYLIILFIALFRKPPIKDWLLVYLFNAVTNGIADSILSAYKTVSYPIRFFPKIFKTHILFDYLIYPTVTVVYNQLTYKDKPFAIFYKVFLITIPMVLMEHWAVKRTKLIRWNKGWNWYYTFISISIKTLFTRLMIGMIRGISNLEKKSTSLSGIMNN
ncbi:CBO0543 family protein [Cytobacillus sp. Hz8]|uniref:CBO0543 family protein n=1 Tax=Cytobacillus sp. Hz8 TaxID=3347168 RepID=UPI0035E0E2F8